MLVYQRVTTHLSFICKTQYINPIQSLRYPKTIDCLYRKAPPVKSLLWKAHLIISAINRTHLAKKQFVLKARYFIPPSNLMINLPVKMP